MWYYLVGWNKIWLMEETMVERGSLLTVVMVESGYHRSNSQFHFFCLDTKL